MMNEIMITEQVTMMNESNIWMHLIILKTHINFAQQSIH